MLIAGFCFLLKIHSRIKFLTSHLQKDSPPVFLPSLLPWCAQTLMTPVQVVGWGDAEVPGFPPPLMGPLPQRQSPSSRVHWEVVDTYSVQIRLNWSDGIIFVKKSIVFHLQDLSDKVKEACLRVSATSETYVSVDFCFRERRRSRRLSPSICVSPPCMGNKRQNYLPKQSVFWMVCNLEWLNSLTVKHQC